MNPNLVRIIVNIVATVLTSLATTNAFPALTTVFATASGLLFGWVNVSKPGAAAKAVAKAEGEKAIATLKSIRPNEGVPE